MLKWQHIEYLFGLVALPLLGLLLYSLLRWKKKVRKQMGDARLVDQLVKSFSPARWSTKVGLVMLALSAILLGAANFQRPGKMQNVNRRGVDVMLVLDVSKSMLARDLKPNRLEKAKVLLTRLADKLENDRIGLVLFAGRAYLQMPLTTDHGATRLYIQNASPDIVPTQGTVIGEALKMANSAFNSKERKYKAIILLSDGEDHDPEAMKVAKDLAANGVMINTIGIGSAEGSPIVDPATNELKKDETGTTVISRLNEAELQQLADISKGRYIRMDNVDDVLITMTQQLDSVEQKSLSDATFIDYISYFQLFLGIALVLLLAEYFLPERKGPLFRPGVTMMILLLCGALSSRAQQENPQIRSGNRLYKQKQMEQAQKQYEAAVKKAPKNPTANYNLGNAQFRNNNYADAAQSYDASAQNAADNEQKERGLYNKGVAMIKQQKLQESIDAWKNALKLNANDEDARENLQKALMQQRQQQQQQSRQEKQKKDPKKDQQDKKEEKNKDQEQPQQPKPQPSKLTKQQVEQYLKTLEQKEKDIQDKINQSKVKAPNQPEKDW